MNLRGNKGGLKKIFIISLWVSLWAGASWGAQSVEQGSSSVPVQEGDRLFIKGFSGKLTLIGKPKAQAVSFKVNRVKPQLTVPLTKGNWIFSFRRVGKQIELVVRGPQSKTAWNFGKGSQRPRFEIIVEAPSMPAEIHWQEAVVRIQGWESDLVVSVKRGEVNSLKGRGSHRINLQKGSLKVGLHQGELDLESYKGKVHVFKSQSNVNLENFAGVSQLEEVSGEIHLTSYKGATELVQCEGRVEFKNIQSPVKIEKFRGIVRGQSQQGSVRVSFVGQARLRVKNEEGLVYLNLPNSAAKVDLGSVKGNIYAPKFLSLTRLPNLKMIRGRLRGSQPGNVYVRTHSGKIFLK